MSTLLNSIRSLCTRRSTLAFTTVALATVAVTAVLGHLRSAASTRIAPSSVTATSGGVVVRGALSQTKVAKNASGDVFYDISIESPAANGTVAAPRAADMILVLDRSGSMAEERKLNYAKAAIRELVGQLGSEDRFALVSFDNSARLEVGLAAMTPESKRQALSVVEGIYPGGSTNISDGFRLAESLIQSMESHRSTRVLLLSDGEANQGIIDVPGLSQIVKGLTRRGAVVSTIGMGLGFNQVLLSALADYGMGNYSYLETLSHLDEILKKDLRDSRA